MAYEQIIRIMGKGIIIIRIIFAVTLGYNMSGCVFRSHPTNSTIISNNI